MHSFALVASFALPLMAGGAAVLAAGLPVLIHLLSRQRHQVVRWAAMRFLVAAQQKSRRSVDRWLLMITRMLLLLLALLGMSAATPWGEKLWSAIVPSALEAVSLAPRTHHILVMDTSLSMTVEDQGKTRFERARELAEQIVATARPGDAFSLVTVGNGVEVRLAGPTYDLELIRQELASLTCTHASGDFASALPQIEELVNRSPRNFPRRQLTFCSDLQRSAWAAAFPQGERPAPEAWQRIQSRAEVAVLDVATDTRDNVAIVDLSLLDPLALAKVPAAINVSVQNFGRNDRAGLRVELLIARPGQPDATLYSLESRPVDQLPAGQKLNLTFTLEGANRFLQPGLHLLQARITTPDDLPWDDRRQLVVDVRDTFRVLIVNGTPHPEPLKRASTFFAEALNPAGKRTEGNPADVRVVSLAEFADSLLTDLTDTDCVVLCDVPRLNEAQVARIEAHLKRGGGLVLGVGPNVEANRDWYNRVLASPEVGWLPGNLGAVLTSRPEEADYRLRFEEKALGQAPFAIFADADSRAALTEVPFRKFLKLEAPRGGKAERLLTFTSSQPMNGSPPLLEPAFVEMLRHRGRIILFTSTWNQDWTEWPVIPNYLPAVNEIVRHCATNPRQRTLKVGDSLEELYPVNTVGLSARVVRENLEEREVVVVVGDEAGVVRWSQVAESGFYRISLAGQTDRIVAVNIPEANSTGLSESELIKVEPSRFEALGAVTVAQELTGLRFPSLDGAAVVMVPQPRGPVVARWILLGVLGVFLAELILAWRLGPSPTALRDQARAQGLEDSSRRTSRPWLGTFLGFALLLVLMSLVLVVVQAQVTGEWLGFLPESARRNGEVWFGVPAAEAGESTRWRLETSRIFSKDRTWERRGQAGLLALGLILIGLIYWRERRGAGSIRRLIIPASLRLGVLALVLLVILPQARLAFEREGWPDIAIILDDSASMSTIDSFTDPQVRARASVLAQTTDLNEVHRLQLAQAILLNPDLAWLDRLLLEKKLRIHIFAVSEQTRLLGEASEPAALDELRRSVQALQPTGPGSKLGDAVQGILKNFRGGSLSTIIMLTDGITTSGEDLVSASREASRAGVPLYLVGLGDVSDPPDFLLADLKCPDEILKGDKLEVEIRAVAKGITNPSAIPVTLYERQGEQLIERDRQTVTPDLAGKTVRFQQVPEELGMKSYVIEIPTSDIEADPTNNRVERQVLVTESKKIKLLYVEGYARYEFRFVKALLEREAQTSAGNRSIELQTLLLDASPGYADLDKSALRDFPAGKELMEYDVVILGDIRPTQIPRAQQLLSDIAEFVKVRGGGLLLLAGEHGNPKSLFDSPLADVLPIRPSDSAIRNGPPTATSENSPITEDYQLRLTSNGRTHPLLRFNAQEGTNLAIWEKLQPFYWYASGYQKKTAAEVLAVHPTRPAEDNSASKHPLILQQFVGAGRVVFFGFDETWRWRYRTQEERFNQFWTQGIRTLARSRVSQIELRTDKQTPYRRDEPIRITVRFPDDAPAPAANVPVRVVVNRYPLRQSSSQPNRTPIEKTTLQLAKLEGTRATYQTLLTRTPEGEYTLTLQEPLLTGKPGEKPSIPRAEVRVIPPPGERDRLEMNQTDLSRAAAESRGKFYTLVNVNQLMDELPEATRYPLNQPREPISLWDHALLYALILAAMTTEWLLRRRERLL